MCHLVRIWTLLSKYFCPLATSGSVSSADTRTVFFSKLIRHWKTSVLALLHVVSEFSVKYCVFYFSESISYSEIGKCLSFLKIPFSDPNQCVMSWLNMPVFYPSFSAGRPVHRYVFHRFPSRTDGKPVFSYSLFHPILPVFLLLPAKFCSLLLRVFLFSKCRVYCEGGNFSKNVFGLGADSVHQANF